MKKIRILITGILFASFAFINSSDAQNIIELLQQPTPQQPSPFPVNFCSSNPTTSIRLAFNVPNAASFSYQWQVSIGNGPFTNITNNATYSQAQSALLIINQLNSGMAGNKYRCIATKPASTLISNEAMLISNQPVTINTQPISQTICEEAFVNLSALAQGSPPYTYQWKKNGVNIQNGVSYTGTSTPILSFSASLPLSGNYSVAVIGAGIGCEAMSNIANVSILPNINQRVTVNAINNQIVCEGQSNVDFVVSFSAPTLTITSQLMTFQWKKNNVDIIGATMQSYRINNASTGDAASYTVVLKSVDGYSCGQAVSTPAILTVNPLTAITSQPVSKTVCEQTNTSYSVAASGTGTLSYQWKKGAVDIAGATAATLALTNVVPGDAASYSVNVTGGCGAVVPSSTAALVVNPITKITTQPLPATQTICEQTNASYTVAASGTGTLTYQWKKAGANIAGATAATLSLNNVVPGDAANYSVNVTGGCGAVVPSSTAALSINPITRITTQPLPATQTICEQTNTSYSVAASGTGTLSYQWKKGAVDIAGATAATLSLTNVVPGDAANYSVNVTGTCGAVVPSSTAALSINPITRITTQPLPATQTICEQTNTSYSVAASGTGTLSYQWKKGAVDIAGATAATLSLTNVVPGDAANYSVNVTGTCGAVVPSSTAALSINPITRITTQPLPATQTICEQTNTSYTVAASGTGLIYQWKKAGTNIAGATAATLALTNVVPGDAASYSVNVTGGCGAVVPSSTAALVVNPITKITTQPLPATQTICEQTNASYTVAASGTGTLTYQWKKAGANIAGATAATLSLNNVVPGDAANYSVNVTGGCGAVVPSSTAALSINPITRITTQPLPATQTICEQTNTSYSVAASGTGTLSYQWKKGAVDIAGATAATLSLTNVVPGDAANYSVNVTGTCGAVVPSSTAALSINPITRITTQPLPATQTICEQTNTSYSVAASGTGLIYQWKKAGTNIAGATAATLALNNVVPGDAANYSVNVLGACGAMVFSLHSALIINPLPIVTASTNANTICSGNIAILTGGGAISYAWSGGISNGVSFVPNITDTYTVTGTNEYNCKNIATKTITVNPLPIITVNASEELICPWTTVTLTANGASSYVWSHGLMNGTGFFPGRTTTYTVTGTDGFGCKNIAIKTITLKAAGCPNSVISANTFHSLYIKTDGTLWGWGSNQYGQLGDGTTINRVSPVQIGSSNNWLKLTASPAHSVGLKSDGTLWAWGNNLYGQLGDGTNTSRNIPIQIGTDNTWVSISTSDYYSTYGLKSNGTLWAWGNNLLGQLGDGTNTSRNIPLQIGTDSNWISISTDFSHSLGIKSNGTLWAWGTNEKGQLGDGTTVNRLVPLQIAGSNWVTVTAGYNHSLGLKSDGSLWSWGDNNLGQLGTGIPGTNYSSPIQIGSDNNWINISTGSFSNLGLKSNGSLWSWGNNFNGQLGTGNNANQNIPLQIGTASNWVIVSAGGSYSLAMKSDLTQYCGAGLNSHGQLGDNTTTDKATFVCSSTNGGRLNANSQNTSGSEQALSDGGLNIYPNPVENELNVAGLEKNTLLQLYNVNDVLVYENMVNDFHKIPFSGFAGGLYILKISTQTTVKVLKIMK